MTIQQTIVNTARALIGFEEKPANSGFKPFPQTFVDYCAKNGLQLQEPEAMFKALGWKPGYAWCDFAAEFVYKTSYSLYDSTYINEFNELFSGSATGTMKRFLDAGWEHSEGAALGALAIWRKKGDWKGHIGIVTEILTPGLDEFRSCEGNTNKLGEREGTAYMEKINTIYGRGSLDFEGFILPKS